MNNLETRLHEVVDAVLRCCVTTIIETGKPSLSLEEVLGPSRKENALLTRTMMAYALRRDGFSVTTTAQLLSRTEKAVRQMVAAHDSYNQTSHAYRIAFEEVAGKLFGRN